MFALTWAGVARCPHCGEWKIIYKSFGMVRHRRKGGLWCSFLGDERTSA